MGHAKKDTRKSVVLNKAESDALDADLRSRIHAALPPASGRNGRRPEGISVEVKDGMVLLRGTARTFREKIRLHRFVMGLRGVRALKDMIRIEPAESVSDERVALLVRQALDAHSELPPGTASVHVRDGVCTIEGHVRSAEERHVAEMVTSNCRGVKSVVNKLNVDPLDEVSDEATTRAVKGALAYCKDFDIEGITVSCVDGRVVLRGLVPTMMDRGLAEEITRLQFGVRAVENHIQVSHHLEPQPATVVENDGPGRSRRAKRGSMRKRSAGSKA
ncbi:MAG: BON domain-containing protein [Planctomycetes bacterium]|nr:BON domain-containing protein [Planctomycetota bacterium]